MSPSEHSFPRQSRPQLSHNDAAILTPHPAADTLDVEPSPALGVAFSQLLAQSQAKPPLFKKGVTDKKQHEITRLAALTTHLCRRMGVHLVCHKTSLIHSRTFMIDGRFSTLVLVRGMWTHRSGQMPRKYVFVDSYCPNTCKLSASIKLFHKET